MTDFGYIPFSGDPPPLASPLFPPRKFEKEGNRSERRKARFLPDDGLLKVLFFFLPEVLSLIILPSFQLWKGFRDL